MRLVKILAAILVLGATVAATSVPAQARWHGGHGGWHGGWHHGWHGGGWGLGFGPGFALGYGAGYPYYSPYYDDGPACRYTRVWRRGYWRRVYRCW
jgi:hypothetical protein